MEIGDVIRCFAVSAAAAVAIAAAICWYKYFIFGVFLFRRATFRGARTMLDSCAPPAAACVQI